MRTLTRTILPIVVVILLVFAVSYFSQYTPTVEPGKQVKARPRINAPSLVFPDPLAMWDPYDREYRREVEPEFKGHYDYWAFNPHPVEARVTLKTKSCTCARVEIGILPADAMANTVPNLGRVCLARGMFPTPGFDPTILGLAPLVNQVKFQPLLEKGSAETPPAVIIPPADETYGPRWCVLRMDFDAKSLGKLHLSAEVIVTGAHARQEEYRPEVRLSVMPPAVIAPNALPLYDINAGDVRQMFVHIWTATRDEVPVQLPDMKNEPCIRLGTPVRLTPDERLGLAYAFRHAKEYESTIGPTKIRDAYRIPITVYERYENQPLPLGPLTRRIIINEGTPFEAITTIGGRVRGNFRLTGERVADDRIKFGDFKANVGIKEVVLINRDEKSGEEPLKLEFVSKSQPWLETALRELPGQPGTWELTVAIPKNVVTGQLPSGTSVMLRVLGPNSRLLRVPVTGSAYY